MFWVMGRWGLVFEKVFKALGCKEVLIAERKGRDSLRKGRTAFDEVIKASSVIVVCVPKDDDTIDLVGELELSMMRKGSSGNQCGERRYCE